MSEHTLAMPRFPFANCTRTTDRSCSNPYPANATTSPTASPDASGPVWIVFRFRIRRNDHEPATRRGMGTKGAGSRPAQRPARSAPRGPGPGFSVWTLVLVTQGRTGSVLPAYRSEVLGNPACGDRDASRVLENPASSHLCGRDGGAGSAHARSIQVPIVSQPTGTGQIPDTISRRDDFFTPCP